MVEQGILKHDKNHGYELVQPSNWEGYKEKVEKYLDLFKEYSFFIENSELKSNQKVKSTHNSLYINLQQNYKDLIDKLILFVDNDDKAISISPKAADLLDCCWYCLEPINHLEKFIYVDYYYGTTVARFHLRCSDHGMNIFKHFLPKLDAMEFAGKPRVGEEELGKQINRSARPSIHHRSAGYYINCHECGIPILIREAERAFKGTNVTMKDLSMEFYGDIKSIYWFTFAFQGYDWGIAVKIDNHLFHPVCGEKYYKTNQKRENDD